jgi:PAS domain S-box-containing protein
MIPQLVIKLVKLRRKILLSIVVAIAILAIIGWVFKVMIFTGGARSFIPIAPLTALLFIFTTIAVYFIKETAPQVLPNISKLFLFITLGLALLVLIQFVFRLSTDIERVFGNIAQPFGNVRIGRMSQVTSVLFILIVLSVLLQYSRVKIIKETGSLLLVFAFGYSFLLIMGYAYNAPLLYTGKITPVALPTAFSFLLLSLVIIDLYRVNLLPKRYRLYSKITIQLAKAFLPVSLFIIIIYGLLDANIKYISKNPAIGSFVLLLIILSLLIAVILSISKTLGTSIEKLEQEKLQIEQDRQQELKRQNEEYYALYEEYKTINEELSQKNEDLLNANQQILESEVKYHSLFENMLNGLAYCKMIYDNGIPVDFVYLEVNKAFEQLTGLKNVVGKNVTEIIPGINNSNPELFNIYGRVALSGIPEKFEAYVEGLRMWFSVSVFSPAKEYFVAVFEVITERKNAERNLKESRKQLFDIIDNTPALIYATDIDGKIILANQALISLFNTTREEIIGKTRMEFLPPEIAEQHRQNELEVIDKKQSVVFEETHMEQEGPHTYYTIKFPLFDSSGRVYSTCGISLDITNRKTMEEQLRVAKEKAEESDRLKTAFLQNMSHEIRTPMNAIMGFAHLLPVNFNNKEKLKIFSEIIEQRCDDLLEIINEILDISKIESGQLPVNLEECNLPDLFNEMYSLFISHRQKLNKGHIDFNVNVVFDPSQSVIITDRVKLKQIFINLINNAFKFTLKGKIEMGFYFDENRKLIFYVSDTGIGIAFEKQTEIFQRFTQIDTKHDSNLGGTGLGLAIVKGLIELLGGKIWLESQPGIGSKFYFTFPYKIGLKIQEKISREKDLAGHRFENKILLIVEDDVYNSAYLKEILADTGFTILQSEFGKNAIEITNEHQVDIILMDIRLPDMEGYEATRIIKSKKPHIKVIAQTAYATEKDRQKSFESGCDEFISKPIKKNKLLSLIHEQLYINS